MSGFSCKIEDFEVLLNASSTDELLGHSRKLANALGFEHFLYGVRMQIPGEKTFEFVLSGYPDQWWNQYVKGNYLQVDPIVAHCSRSALPKIWLQDQYPTEDNQKVMEEAQAYGLKSGLSIPIHAGHLEVGILSLASDRPPSKKEIEQLQRSLPESHMMSAFLHEAVHRLVLSPKIAAERPQLTARELECLKWAANGKTSWETGQIINCTERTVNFHMGNIIQKLKVNNRRQAVAKAISLGLINT